MTSESTDPPSRAERAAVLWAPETFAANTGTTVGVSDWVRVDQPMINDFARVTGDYAFIHVDPERAKATRHKGTIAHGMLILSLLPLFARTAMPRVRNARLGANYGFDRVRFVAPVPVDTNVRGRFQLTSFDEPVPHEYRCAYEVTVELDGATRPAAVAAWHLIYWLSS